MKRLTPGRRWLDWGNPTILNVGGNINNMSQELAIIPEDYVNQVGFYESGAIIHC